MTLKLRSVAAFVLLALGLAGCQTLPGWMVIQGKAQASDYRHFDNAPLARAASPDAGTPPSSGVPAEAAAHVTASTVKVEGQACDRIQEGTGFVAAENLIVTNAHVVAGESKTRVETSDGRRLDTLEALEDTTVAVVRTDLRGRDHRALRGLRKTIERDRPVIVTEFWPEGIRDVGDDPVAVLAEYADMGYTLASLPGEPRLMGDGATVVTLAESMPSGSLTLALTPTGGPDPRQVS